MWCEEDVSIRTGSSRSYSQSLSLRDLLGTMLCFETIWPPFSGSDILSQAQNLRNAPVKQNLNKKPGSSLRSLCLLSIGFLSAFHSAHLTPFIFWARTDMCIFVVGLFYLYLSFQEDMPFGKVFLSNSKGKNDFVFQVGDLFQWHLKDGCSPLCIFPGWESVVSWENKWIEEAGSYIIFVLLLASEREMLWWPVGCPVLVFRFM